MRILALVILVGWCTALNLSSDEEEEFYDPEFMKEFEWDWEEEFDEEFQWDEEDDEFQFLQYLFTPLVIS